MKGTDNRVTDNRVKGTDVVLKGTDSCRVGHCTEGAAAAGGEANGEGLIPDLQKAVVRREDPGLSTVQGKGKRHLRFRSASWIAMPFQVQACSSSSRVGHYVAISRRALHRMSDAAKAAHVRAHTDTITLSPRPHALARTRARARANTWQPTALAGQRGDDRELLAAEGACSGAGGRRLRAWPEGEWQLCT